ncbi:MAG: protein phosphatase 2C domain-containing protein [Austwickia sp.]|nr:protein phosphatase 2C domain-containing protein [Actinomycetota bacterium]MCO5307983.1 protein phosphatase 2C domain-containing protein [Austwickia sp.]
MTTPPRPPDQPDTPRPDPDPDRTWNPFRRLKEAFQHDDAPPAGPPEPAEPAEPAGLPEPADGAGTPRPDGAEEPRLGPAAPTGFDWLGTSSPDTTTPPPPADVPPPADGPLTPPAGRDSGGMLVLGGAPSATLPGAPVVPLPNGGLCAECGGTVDPDGYCENCGAKAADPRHHVEIVVEPWLAGVCDRGRKHPGNEDALAIRGGDGPAGQRAAIVVCDGVSSAPNSAAASAAAALAAVEVLTTPPPSDSAEEPEDLAATLGRRLEHAAQAASQAVAAVAAQVAADGPPGGGPSCTFVAAIVQDGAAVVGSIGDSRAYWFGDDGTALRLTEDDSWAAEQIRAGASRAEAEAGPHAHTITRWLGEDCPDHRPTLTTLQVTRPGWLLLCSDGLWNYASEPEALVEVFRAQSAAVPPARGAAQPAAELAAALVDWANAQGGHDNITVGLVYLLPTPTAAVSPTHASGAAAGDVPSQTSTEED